MELKGREEAALSVQVGLKTGQEKNIFFLLEDGEEILLPGLQKIRKKQKNVQYHPVYKESIRPEENCGQKTYQAAIE